MMTKRKKKQKKQQKKQQQNEQECEQEKSSNTNLKEGKGKQERQQQKQEHDELNDNSFVQEEEQEEDVTNIISSIIGNATEEQADEKRNMKRAIKMLAYVTISQTKKYLLFKKKYLVTKISLIEEGNKMRVAEAEKEMAEDNFFRARAEFLKEKDIRIELSEEVQYLAKKNNLLRKEKKKQVESRQEILDNIIKTWEELKESPVIASVKPPLQSISNTASPVQKGESTHEVESTRIKELETLVSQLTSKLKQRDDHLNSIKQHFEGSESDFF